MTICEVHFRNLRNAICLVACFSFAVFAQSATENTFLDRTSLGIKLGANFPNMAYSDEKLDVYQSSVYATALFELFGEYAIISSLSIRPGFKYTTRGQHINIYSFNYEFNAKYIELTVPAAYTFQTTNNITPYMLIGPVLGVVCGGDIRLYGDIRYKETEGKTYKTKLNKSNTSPISFGFYFGQGLKYNLLIKEFLVTLGVEAGYHLGLIDKHSDKEHDGTANALNFDLYEINGSRTNRGFELGLTFAIPLVNFKKPKQPEPEPLPEPPPPPPPEPEPVPEPPPPPPPEPEPVPEPPPPPPPEPEPEGCYTIEEMKEFISEGQDIRGKKICAIKQVKFKHGRAELLAEDKVYLDQMVIFMNTSELINIRVNGHTDNVGGSKLNMNLSRIRAKSVEDYLKSKGISPSRLSSAFFGSTRPIADNKTEDGRAINRRVEFEIIDQ